MEKLTPYRYRLIGLLQNNGYKCFYCGRPLTLETATIDHIKPKSKCRTFEEAECFSNLAPACYDCNQEKGTQNAFTFLISLYETTITDRTPGSLGPCAMA